MPNRRTKKPATKAEISDMSTEQLKAALVSSLDVLFAPHIVENARRLGTALVKIHQWPAEDDSTDEDVLLAQILACLGVSEVPEYPNSSAEEIAEAVLYG